MAELGLIQLTKEYQPGVRALVDVNLTVADGEFVVIVGPSGCGKTTLLRLVAGLERVTTGEVRLDGRCVNQVAPADRNVAMVFQEASLYPHLTVAQNMEFGVRMRGQSRAVRRERVAWAAAQLQLNDTLDRYPDELSGGQRQRVAMGRALVRDPQIFLLDEPLAHLDGHLRAELREAMIDLGKSIPRTTLYVTHDQREAMTLGQRLVVLAAGVVQQVGTPTTLYDLPANAFVASFLGDPGMNLWPVVIADQQVRIEGTETPVCPYRVGLPNGRYLCGVRPEDGRRSTGNEAKLLLQIDRVEMLGHSQFVHGHIQSHCFTFRWDREPAVAAGSTADIAIDPRDLHWFAAAAPHGRVEPTDCPVTE